MRTTVLPGSRVLQPLHGCKLSIINGSPQVRAMAPAAGKQHELRYLLLPCRGLEQETALPRDSYLQPYYKDVYGYLRVGPPLLLVVQDLNMTRHSPDIDAVCSISGCRDDSLLNQVRLLCSCIERSTNGRAAEFAMATLRAL